uniref:probable leucine-rich repeat receptor-like serine/threonine-protein kinase At3g14840 n=1 Tax=Fragaria vesca subsp. vesca TaxID=101020 RepID=UPI0005C9E314|nr:PREDICTED: probable leucine-rich repeat receptor-like serine/threonine-protein kinase At3g14840 [Fragaria vesca subsp. vesca]
MHWTHQISSTIWDSCHRRSILTGQDLDGVLPASLAKLPYLKQVNLLRNDLSGSIPREWASTKLEYLVLRSCNITGKIPEYISTMTNLTVLDLSFNRLEGTIPNFANIMQLSTM